LASWIDRSLFAPNRLYRRTTDPCGLLSTLPAIATALFGVLTGVWLRTTRTTSQKARGLAAAGTGCVVAGLAWSTVFPINKNLWTSSYTLVTGGLTLLLLALSIYIVDVKRIGRNGSGPREAWWVCLVFGTNAIAAYMVSELVSPLLNLIHLSTGNPKTLYFHWLQQRIPTYGFAELLFGLTMVAITWVIIYALYRKRIFLKV
jgi:predicted acyltransferase